MILRGKKRINYMKKAVCMVTACLVLGQTMPVYAQGTSWIDQVEITAHRGDSLKALENTLPAFEKAIESGSDWIELDVNETKDNVPVVFHDCNLKRIMGRDAKIRDLTLEEIKAVHPVDSMGPAFGSIRIPSLEEALNTCKGKISLNIEIKEDGTQSGDFVDRVIQLVRDKKMVDQCMITSFDYNVLVKVKALEPSFKTGYITSRDIGDPGQYVAADQFMISIELVRKELVDQIHGLGKKAVAWTINDAYSLKKCEEAQVDNMITDKPGSLRSL